MRVVVTHIGGDGAVVSRRVDTAVRSDGGEWEELTSRALVSPPEYRPSPGGPVYQVQSDEQVIMVAERDLAGPLRDLVLDVLAQGDPA